MENHSDYVVEQFGESVELVVEPPAGAVTSTGIPAGTAEQLPEELAPEVLSKLRNARHGGGLGVAGLKSLLTDVSAAPAAVPMTPLDTSRLDLNSVAKIDGLWSRLVDDVRHELLRPPAPLPADQLVDGVATVLTAEQLQVAMGMTEVDEIHIRTSLDEVVTVEGPSISGAKISAYGQARVVVSGGKVFAYDTVQAIVRAEGWVRTHDRVEVTEVSGGQVLAFGISSVSHVSGGLVSAFGDAQVYEVSGGKVVLNDRSRATRVAGGQVVAYDDTWVVGVLTGRVSAFGDAQVTDVAGGQVEAFGTVQISGVTHGRLTVYGSVRVVGVRGGWVRAAGDVTVALEGYGSYDPDMGYVALNGEDSVTGVDGEPVPGSVTVTDFDGVVFPPQ